MKTKIYLHIHSIYSELKTHIIPTKKTLNQINSTLKSNNSSTLPLVNIHRATQEYNHYMTNEE